MTSLLLTYFFCGCAVALGGAMETTDLKSKLTQLQYHVTQECGTEPPFKNEYWNNKKLGIYVDIVSGEPLFSSTDKFESGTGWPSFLRPLVGDNILSKVDRSHGMTRVEVRSKKADSHLGHLFNDGPAPSGMRYCINSAALKFIPADELEKNGYGHYAYLFTDSSLGAPGKYETATFAAGCFWGVEHAFENIRGVIRVTSGYTAGHVPDPDYKMVCGGKTGHAEAVKIIYDPAIVSFRKLVDYFWEIHDPTTKNRQGLDIGSQYRSAIFYHTDEQKQDALASLEYLKKSGRVKRKVVTEIVPASRFYPAEEYHQDYFKKHPDRAACHVVPAFK